MHLQSILLFQSTPRLYGATAKYTKYLPLNSHPYSQLYQFHSSYTRSTHSFSLLNPYFLSHSGCEFPSKFMFACGSHSHLLWSFYPSYSASSQLTRFSSSLKYTCIFPIPKVVFRPMCNICAADSHGTNGVKSPSYSTSPISPLKSILSCTR